MISRRQIISQTNEDRSSSDQFDPYSSGYGKVEDDVWFNEKNLFKDHMLEVFNKWNSIDDEIWCKLIIMERNRRIAKAYARVPILTINGTEVGFDGFRIGLNGFDNPHRDFKTDECKKRIGHGIKIKMDDSGNIFIKRFSKCCVYVKSWKQIQLEHLDMDPRAMSAMSSGIVRHHVPITNNLNAQRLTSKSSTNDSSCSSSSSTSGQSSGHDLYGTSPVSNNAVSDEILHLNGRIDQDKAYLLFDIKKFQSNITQELKRPYPDRTKLEHQCISIIGLVRDADDILNLPCWIMVINIVAIEMLKSRMPLSKSPMGEPPLPLPIGGGGGGGNHSTVPRFLSIFDQQSKYSASGPSIQNGVYSNKDEDPYSLPANASSSERRSSVNNLSSGGTGSTMQMSALDGSHLHRSQQYRMQNNNQGLNGRGLLRRNNVTNGNDGRHASSMANINASVNRSGSNNNIYGAALAANANRTNYLNNGEFGGCHPNQRYQMTPKVDQSVSGVPPKLPPRDFVNKGRSKSSSNVYQAFRAEDASETGVPLAADTRNGHANLAGKKNDGNNNSNNINSSSNSNNNNNGSVETDQDRSRSRRPRRTRLSESTEGPLKPTRNGQESEINGKEGKNKGRPTSNDDEYAIEGEEDIVPKRHDDDGNDSMVDSSDDKSEFDDDKPKPESVGRLRRSRNMATKPCNELDIPTPDYEHSGDEKISGDYIYSVDSNFQMPKLFTQQMQSKQRASASEDLYYSGFQARVPQFVNKSSRKGVDKVSNHHPMINDPKYSKQGHNDIDRTTGMPVNKGDKENDYQRLNMQPSNGKSHNNTPAARYRSASMQRYYVPNGHPTNRPYRYGPAENIYGLDMPASNNNNLINNYHHVATKSNGYNARTPASRLMQQTTKYSGRESSSGTYGNNSSSSSSEYVDWQPHMRKVNSSGYLNSLFRNYVASPVTSLYNNTKNGSGNSKKTSTNSTKTSTNSKTVDTNVTAKKKFLQASQTNGKQLPPQTPVTSNTKRGPEYRIYDSSNDSDPSYTNSSDGFDIYDRIGMNGSSHCISQHPQTRDLYVGEWENI